MMKAVITLIMLTIVAMGHGQTLKTVKPDEPIILMAKPIYTALDTILQGKEIADFDNDHVNDTVYNDNSRIVCRLSSRKFVPMKSQELYTPKIINITAYGFLLVDTTEYDGIYSEFSYEPSTQRMRMCRIGRAIFPNDECSGYSDLYMFTGEYKGNWSYITNGSEMNGMAPIDTVIACPSVYLEDFSEQTLQDYADRDDSIFNVYKEKTMREKGQIKTPYVKPEDVRSTTIHFLGGTVTLELSEGTDFPCVGIGFNDDKINNGVATYMEIKRMNGRYITSFNHGKKYKDMSKAVEGEFKRDITEFYARQKQKARGKEVWDAFVRDGGLRQSIDFIKEVVDDEFLDSPWADFG